MSTSVLARGHAAALQADQEPADSKLTAQHVPTFADWQTVGMAYSYQQSKQPGAITRVMCCTENERKRYDHELLNLMPTHVAPSFAHNPKTNDDYAAFNKPGAVVDWLSKVTPKEHWILVIDSGLWGRHQVPAEGWAGWALGRLLW